jgi:hypothetical protein
MTTQVYKLFMSMDGKEIAGVILNGNTAIPANPDNTDYQAYLAWVAEGNEPIPADGEAK